MDFIDEETILKIAKANRLNPYVDITPYELKMGLPFATYNNFYPAEDEVIVYATPAFTFNDKEKVVGYTGRTAGVSVRVAKGVSVRTGGSGGRAIRQNVRETSNGDLIITNKRIVFSGIDDNFDINAKKISVIKPIDRHSFLIQAGRTVKKIIVDEALIIYTMSCISFVTQYSGSEKDLYNEVIEDRNHYTSEQLDLIKQTKEQADSIIAKNEEINNATTKKSNNKKYWLIALAIIFVIAIISSMGGNKNVTKYTDREIINLNGHPKLYDTYDYAKNFYQNVDKNKVLIYNVPSGGSSYWSQQEKRLIYMESDSYSAKHIDEINLNLEYADFSNSLTLDEVVEITKEYLPLDTFKEYYKVKRKFIYESSDVKTYHYAWELAEKGIEYHNNGHQELNKDIGFTIIHNTRNNTYNVKINIFADDISAVASSSNEWIEQNTEKWDIEI